jgi:type IV pilus assembly protein PilX
MNASFGSRPRRPAPARRERGVALFIALVVLLIITVLGVSGLQTTTLEERMAASARDRDIAFQAAESALAQGEAFVDTIGPGGLGQFSANSNGLYLPEDTAGEPDIWEQVDWDDAGDVAEVGTSIPGVVDGGQPRYIVEYMTTLLAADDSLNISNVGAPIGAPTEIFRITSYAQGGSARAVVMLQATYGRILQ